MKNYLACFCSFEASKCGIEILTLSHNPPLITKSKPAMKPIIETMKLKIRFITGNRFITDYLASISSQGGGTLLRGSLAAKKGCKSHEKWIHTLVG